MAFFDIGVTALAQRIATRKDGRATSAWRCASVALQGRDCCGDAWGSTPFG